ncbi:type 1 glutamine amidotransferase|uniref:type 1 glutamine amidotransferase domain-containing protein n=1 Tax=Noviherbaspirillum sp. L7-7A TaxID=2850560 RepID=UPI001C2C5120|nr:type 1 glutamine amidotransferase domain-containing protein [Noviherbaspirillum sp. L7-7A]MBV0879935.1 type 1 glutamine amidotransferase [Noviherbaspirillum sp. L7-7A]
MDPALNGLHIAILVTDGFEQVELTQPKDALEGEGAITKIISDKRGMVQGMNHDKPADQFPVDLTFDEAYSQDFDAVLLPGGEVNSARIRSNELAQKIVKGINAQGKPIAVICHGAWLLASAGLVQGKTMTSHQDLEQDLKKAGVNWVDQEVVVDGSWVSSRKPDDIPAFNARMIDVFGQRMRDSVAGTPDEGAVGIASS